MGSLGRAKEACGSFVGECIHSGAHWGRQVHSGSRGYTRPRLVNVAFIRVRVGSLPLAKLSSGLFFFCVASLGRTKL